MRLLKFAYGLRPRALLSSPTLNSALCMSDFCFEALALWVGEFLNIDNRSTPSGPASSQAPAICCSSFRSTCWSEKREGRPHPRRQYQAPRQQRQAPRQPPSGTADRPPLTQARRRHPGSAKCASTRGSARCSCRAATWCAASPAPISARDAPCADVSSLGGSASSPGSLAAPEPRCKSTVGGTGEHACVACRVCCPRALCVFFVGSL